MGRGGWAPVVRPLRAQHTRFAAVPRDTMAAAGVSPNANVACGKRPPPVWQAERPCAEKASRRRTVSRSLLVRVEV